MTQIILDASAANTLHALNHPVELCDPSGQILGRFVPQVDLSRWEAVTPDVTDEELDRREQSTEWYSTDEVLAHLNDLEKK